MRGCSIGIQWAAISTGTLTGSGQQENQAVPIGAKHSNPHGWKQTLHRPRRQRLSRSRRAELQFPASRLERCLREGRYAQRLSSTTPVFPAGVLEYLTANILEKLGKEAENSHRVCITPEHVKRALQKDEQLRWLLELENDTHSQVEEMPQPEEEEEEEEEEEKEQEEEEEVAVMGGRRRRRRRRRSKDS
ncbi:LOW QUALITY PROTEIN: histone H2A-like 3 [Macaca fascicularis]|uniref:LOW QUALITY PROTEIN: histone H2A-like 3 n=1 Tax=Macaca fascicularis TaxID=9541 RepID=UPI0032B05A18